jgi:predicted metalloprotease with PDZ domain
MASLKRPAFFTSGPRDSRELSLNCARDPSLRLKNPNAFLQAGEKLGKVALFDYTLGFTATEDGKLIDVIVGSPAYQAGIGPNMKLVAVNGRKWAPDLLHAAIKAAQGSDQPIELLIENAQFFKTYSVAYHDGEKNPHLERVSGKPDVLTDVLKPLTH